MYKELIRPTEISIKDKKNVVKGNVIRAAVYARMKVVEIATADNERFYFIYYKNSLIYGEILDKIEEGSFINKAFQDGIVIESPHPILNVLIPSQSVAIPNKKKLFSQLQIHFSLQEIAYIATTLDSFFDKDDLVKIIDKIYFHYRRSGNFMKSFQVNQILHDFVPSLKIANERLNSQEYNYYHDFYNSSSLSSILQKDPQIVELHCFQKRANPEMRIFLEDIYRKQECLMELLCLWTEYPKIEQIEMYTEIALQFFTMNDWIFILGELNINPYRVLPEAKSIIEKMIQEQNYETAALYLFSFIHDLPSSYEAVLNTLWGNLSAGFIGSHLDDFTFMFQQLIHKEHSKQLEQKLFQLAVALLGEDDLKTVHEKLLPLQKSLPHSLVVQKMNRMLALLEDPDRMMELGDYYAEFKQFDKAIDCYFWEMELHPQDPAPVQKIGKMYQFKGMAKEAAAYQMVYLEIKGNKGEG